jgi:DNA-binding SARP family transcriptional activator
VEFRILGPLEVVEEGRLVELGGRKQRVLVALLLVEANSVVSCDRLIDALWEDEPTETALKALQVYVSKLRKELGRDRIVTKSPGYRLRVEPGELDLDRFERLVEEGGRRRLTEALALWRGPPLADFAHTRFALHEIGRLEERRLAVLEQRIEADLALGGHAELVAELESLVAEHPLRERLRALLMLALYRSGRQAEALEVYQDARRTLVEELGIEPGHDLRELHSTILRQDRELELEGDPEATAEVPDGPVGFVGRDSELAALTSGLDDAFAGRGRLFLVHGEPGIGKSRLADEVAAAAKARGANVLVGRSWEAGGAPAYWPWMQSLRAYVRRAEAGALRRQLGGDAAEVAQIIPELHDLFPGLTELERLESDAARFRLFEATSSFLRKAAADRPLALVLDDLHAADEPSLLLLRYVASGLGDSRILIIGTFRDLDPTVQDPLESALAELGREPVTSRIHLSGLSEGEVGRLAEVTAQTQAPKRLVADLYAETEGNPLFVSEIVRLLAAEGRLGDDRLGGIPIPETIREAIGQRLRRLSGECRRVLSLGSVFGREFGLVALERVADYTGIDRLLSVLDEAITARVVEEIPASFGRLRFGHALTRDTLYDEIPSTHRARLHRRVAEVLETLYTGNPEPHLAELTHHFALAVPAAPPDKAIEYARRAGDRALDQLAYEEAARLYEMALAVADRSTAGDEEARCELLLALGEAEAAGNRPAAKKAFLAAADAARRLSLPNELARAAVGYGGRIMYIRAGSDRRLVPLLEEGLAALPEGDLQLRVRLLARLAGALRDEPSRERRDRLSLEAVEVARHAQDPVALAYALDGRAAAIMAEDTLDECLALGTELRDLAERVGNPERVVQGHWHRIIVHVMTGNMGEADADLEAVSHLVHELGQPVQHWQLSAARAMFALAAGQLAAAEEWIDQAFAIGERAQPEMAIAVYGLQQLTLRDFTGGLDDIASPLDALVAEYPARPVFRCASGYLDAMLGRAANAKRALDELVADDCAALPFDMERLYGMSLLAETCALLDDAGSAPVLYGLLHPWAGFNAADHPEGIRGSVSRYLGLLAMAMKNWDDAEGHFEDGLAMNERMGWRPWLAHTQADYARMLLARDGTGDSQRAAELLDRALVTYRELGMDAYAARASSPAGGTAVHGP